MYEKSLHTLCKISVQPLLAEASTILDRSLSHTTIIFREVHVLYTKFGENGESLNLTRLLMLLLY